MPGSHARVENAAPAFASRREARTGRPPPAGGSGDFPSGLTGMDFTTQLALLFSVPRHQDRHERREPGLPMIPLVRRPLQCRRAALYPSAFPASSWRSFADSLAAGRTVRGARRVVVKLVGDSSPGCGGHPRGRPASGGESGCSPRENPAESGAALSQRPAAFGAAHLDGHCRARPRGAGREHGDLVRVPCPELPESAALPIQQSTFPVESRH